MKYREKPLTVEAVRYQKNVIMPIWFIKMVNENIIVINKEETCDINTPDGVLKSNPGDYIILDTCGKVYPCRPEIFEMRFEKVVGRSEGFGRLSV